MNTTHIQLTNSSGKVAVAYDHAPMVLELGIGIPLNHRWWWSFDGSLWLMESREESASDHLGDYSALALTYHGPDGPLIRQRLKVYEAESYQPSHHSLGKGGLEVPTMSKGRSGGVLVVETTALRELQGVALEDSFFHTTFNSPVVRFADGLSYLTYTWGLQPGEGTGIGGHFPDAAIVPDLARLPEQLRRAGFSPVADIHRTTEKSFAPLIAYDAQERTVVMSPLDHFLISPLRLIDTPAGLGVARGLHGSVDLIPSGTTTQTALVFGQGLVATVLKWGDLLLRKSGQSRTTVRPTHQELDESARRNELGKSVRPEPVEGHTSKGRNTTLVKYLGFWNCYGSYYAELFRQMNAATFQELAAYFQEADIPVRYFGLDLWYLFDRVGFARHYRPDPTKYPEGLKSLFQQTGLPFLLHMSAFDPDTEHQESYQFVVDEGSAYPAGAEFYRDRASEFKEWGAMGIWPDFLRTQLQNSRSLRDHIGTADQWFDGLCRAMAQEGLDVMLCMPTVGHYLASTAYPNVTAVRTSTDYVNHQPGQLEILARSLEEYRIPNTSRHNLRQNLLTSLLAGAVGLAPSYDVFITIQEHPEGFAEPEAPKQALARALSAGIVGIGDKVGHVDKAIIDRLAFPDGTLSQPDHPLYPMVSTLQSDVLALYTTTAIGRYRWSYVALFNLSNDAGDYNVDLGPFLEGPEGLVYDHLSGQTYSLVGARHAVPLPEGSLLSGKAEPGEYRYVVIPPKVGDLYLLGFPDKYVTVSQRQVRGITDTTHSPLTKGGSGGVEIDLELPIGRSYAFAVLGAERLEAEGQGLSNLTLERRGELTYIRFQVELPGCRLILRY
jgi:hypothetical protein